MVFFAARIRGRHIWIGARSVVTGHAQTRGAAEVLPHAPQSCPFNDALHGLVIIQRTTQALRVGTLPGMPNAQVRIGALHADFLANNA